MYYVQNSTGTSVWSRSLDKICAMCGINTKTWEMGVSRLRFQFVIIEFKGSNTDYYYLWLQSLSHWSEPPLSVECRQIENHLNAQVSKTLTKHSCVHQDITLINTHDSCHWRQKLSLVGVGGIRVYKLTPFHLSFDKLVSLLFTSGLQHLMSRLRRKTRRPLIMWPWLPSMAFSVGHFHHSQ